MTFSQMPPPPAGWGSNRGQRDPGLIPLRPLTVGEFLSIGFAIARRHLRLLGPIAVFIAVVSSVVSILTLRGMGGLESFATGEWIQQWRAGVDAGSFDAVPTGVYVAVGASSLISIIGGLALSGIAAGCAAADSVSSRPSAAEVSARLQGRGGALLVVSVIVAVTLSVGSLFFIIPGVLAYLVWAAAAPAVVMERATVGAALVRSVRMTKGHRLRILGVTVLILLITGVIDGVISSVVLKVAGSLTPVMSLIVSGAVGAVVAALTMSWTGAVIALIYIDIRMRAENLGPALRAFAASNPDPHPDPHPGSQPDSPPGSGLDTRPGS